MFCSVRVYRINNNKQTCYITPLYSLFGFWIAYEHAQSLTVQWRVYSQGRESDRDNRPLQTQKFNMGEIGKIYIYICPPPLTIRPIQFSPSTIEVSLHYCGNLHTSRTKSSFQIDQFQAPMHEYFGSTNFQLAFGNWIKRMQWGWLESNLFPTNVWDIIQDF